MKADFRPVKQNIQLIATVALERAKPMNADRMQTLLEGMRDLAAKAQLMPITNETMAAGMALAEMFEEFDLLILENRTIPTEWERFRG